MGAELRAISLDELSEFVRTIYASFGHHAGDEEVEDARALAEPGRVVGAFDSGRLVGGLAVLSLELTLPGGATVPAAGLTEAGVLPTHRRQGLFRALMAEQLADIRERGEPVAALTASEGAIYERFGYGVATLATAVEVGRRSSAFKPPLIPPASGHVRLLAPHELAAALPPTFERYRRAQPGEVSRSAGYWEALLRDRERRRHGAGARFTVVHETQDGVIDGYASYRLRQAWTQRQPDFRLVVEEVVAPSPEVRAALWRYLLDVDLVGTVTANNLPMDEPLRWMLADADALCVTGTPDFLWLRLVDVPAALAARRYATSGKLVVQVNEPALSGGSVRCLLEAGPDGAECRPTSASPDLRLQVADLSSAYLGGVRFATLARAGRVVEHGPGGVERADALFASDPIPHCLTDF
jgi:predicted acetyltransferase